MKGRHFRPARFPLLSGLTPLAPGLRIALAVLLCVLVAATFRVVDPRKSPGIRPRPAARQVVVDTPGGTAAADRDDSASSVAGARVHELGAAAARAASSGGTTQGRVRYVVKPGDTLSSIATFFDLKGYEALYRANRSKLIHGPGIIYVGEIITVNNGRMQVSSG